MRSLIKGRARRTFRRGLPHLLIQRWPRLSTPHEAIQIGSRQATLQVAKRDLVPDLPSGIDQATHRRPVEGSANADPSRARSLYVCNREGAPRNTCHEIDRSFPEIGDRTKAVPAEPSGIRAAL